MKTKEEIFLGMKITDILLEFGEIDENELTRSDYEGIAGAKAIEIIKLVRGNDEN